LQSRPASVAAAACEACPWLLQELAGLGMGGLGDLPLGAWRAPQAPVLRSGRRAATRAESGGDLLVGQGAGLRRHASTVAVGRRLRTAAVATARPALCLKWPVCQGEQEAGVRGCRRIDPPVCAQLGHHCAKGHCPLTCAPCVLPSLQRATQLCHAAVCSHMQRCCLFHRQLGSFLVGGYGLSSDLTWRAARAVPKAMRGA